MPSYRWVFFEKDGQLLIYQGFNQSLNFAVSQFGLGLTFKLRVGNLDADDPRESLARIFTGKTYF